MAGSREERGFQIERHPVANMRVTWRSDLRLQPMSPAQPNGLQIVDQLVIRHRNQRAGAGSNRVASRSQDAGNSTAECVRRETLSKAFLSVVVEGVELCNAGDVF